MTDSTFSGRLLVASPALYDPNFDRTVVFMVEHGDDGALGLVLNRPSATGVGEALPGWDRVVREPAVFFVGGPVARDTAIGLADAQAIAGSEGWAPLGDHLGTVDLARDPDELGLDGDIVRVFVGHAGWGPGQLEEELAEGAWLVLDATPDDPLSTDPDRLWRDVLRRQGGRLAWLANVPPDPSVN